LKVTVKSSARLHMGIIDVNGGLGRLYSSLGLAILTPNVVVEASTSNKFLVDGEDKERARDAASKFLDHYGIEKRCHINIVNTIPTHVGLGSGTQLKLAVGRSLAKLFNLQVSSIEISRVLGRGSVSGIGTALFEKGGFVVDGGVRYPIDSGISIPPPEIVRLQFPEDWHFVIAIPRNEKGLSDKDEALAFEKLSSAPPEVVGQISRMLLMKMLPSIVEQDISGFGSSLNAIQTLVGGCFSQVQGGTFAGSNVESIVRLMLDNGAFGAGQSSWGPAVYGVVKERTDAELLHEKVKAFLDTLSGGSVFFSKCSNKGAIVAVDQNQ